MAYTYPGFKSIVDGVYSAEDIDDIVGSALLYQHTFEKRTSPWEMAEWEEGELENFIIDVQEIDRLYYIYQYDDGVSGRDYDLVARLDHKGRSVYVQLTAGCNFTGFNGEDEGEIYLSLDAQIFLKSIVSKEYNPHNIWKSMVEDGLSVEEPSDFDLGPPTTWNNVPMLKFLSHMNVYSEQESLHQYEDVLPRPLVASIDEFKKVRRTRDHHDKGY